MIQRLQADTMCRLTLILVYAVMAMLAVVGASRGVTLDTILMEPCGTTKKESTYSMADLTKRMKFFKFILKAVQLPKLFLEREGVSRLYGNSDDCPLLKVPTHLRTSSRPNKTLIHLYRDLTIYAGILTTVENREQTWIINKRLLQEDALDGKIRHYAKSNVFNIMCAIYKIIQRPSKIKTVVRNTIRVFHLDTERTCSLFQTVNALEHFEKFIENSVDFFNRHSETDEDENFRKQNLDCDPY